MKELFEKIHIKSENDLPKKVGNYHVQLIDGSGHRLRFPFNGDVGYNVDVNYWLKNVDYYLRPVEQKPDCYEKEFVEWMFSKQQVFDHQAGEWISNLDYAYSYWLTNIKNKAR